MATSSRHIYGCESKHNPPKIDSNEIPYYSINPTLVILLKNGDEETQLKVLDTLKKLLLVPKQYIKAIECELTKVLTGLIGSDNNDIENAGLECLIMLSCKQSGKKEILANNTLSSILPRMKSENISNSFLLNLYKLVKAMSTFQNGSIELMEAQYIPVFIRHASELNNIKYQKYALELLHSCINTSGGWGAREALEEDAVRKCLDLLNHTSSEIRLRACRCLVPLTFDLKGKKQAYDYNAIDALSNLLHDDDCRVRALAVSVITNVCVINHAKIQMIESNSVTMIVKMLNSVESDDEIGNALKAIATLSAHPEARTQLQVAIDRIKELTLEQNKVIRRSAEIALEQVTWSA